MEVKNYAAVLKALGEETRLKIFDMLRDGTLCACKILEGLDISQPTLSHHMKVLCDCGLVVAEKDWKWTYYTLNCDTVKEIAAFLSDTKCLRR